MFGVVQGKRSGPKSAWVLVLHPQDSILEDPRTGVCSVVHTSASLWDAQESDRIRLERGCASGDRNLNSSEGQFREDI